MTNYFKLIYLHKKLIVFIAVLCGILSFIFAKIYPITYTASILFLIQRVNKEQTPDFQYDNYYGIQAIEFIGNTVVGLLQSPELISEIYKRANLDKDNVNILRETKKFRPKQLSSHLVRLKITNKNLKETEKLINISSEVIDNKIKQLEINSRGQNSFKIKTTKPIITLNKYNPILVAIFGLVCGLFLGISFVFLKEYFKEETK